MVISIPTTAYVRQFLLLEYGPSPYYLDVDSKNKLRLEFLSVHIHTPYSSLYTHAEVQVDLGKSQLLQKYYQNNRIQFDRGVFGAHEFFAAFFHQVEGMYRLVKMQESSSINMNYRIAIDMFMKRYGITEEMYSYDNLYRQFSRQKRSRRVYQKNRTWDAPSQGVFRLRLKPKSFFNSTSIKK